jgi:hypothetical protein
MMVIALIMIVTSPKYLEYFTCWVSYRHETEPAKSSSTISKWSYGRLSNGFWLMQENKSSGRFLSSLLLTLLQKVLDV